MADTRTVRVEGLRELLRVTDQLPKQVRKDIRDQLRQVAEPVRREAQELFLTRVSSNQRKTRYGVSVRKAGTISVEQRVKGKSGNPKLHRPGFTKLVWQRSLAPAVEHNEREVVAGFNRVLDDLERMWRR